MSLIRVEDSTVYNESAAADDKLSRTLLYAAVKEEPYNFSIYWIAKLVVVYSSDLLIVYNSRVSMSLRSVKISINLTNYDKIAH